MDSLRLHMAAALVFTAACQSPGSTPEGSQLSVSGSSTRACDLVLSSSGKLVAAPSESAIVRTHQVRNRVAISFANENDKPFTSDFLELQWESDDDPEIEVVDATCYDRAGRALENAAVTIR